MHAHARPDLPHSHPRSQTPAVKTGEYLPQLSWSDPSALCCSGTLPTRGAGAGRCCSQFWPWRSPPRSLGKCGGLARAACAHWEGFRRDMEGGAAHWRRSGSGTAPWPSPPHAAPPTSSLTPAPPHNAPPSSPHPLPHPCAAASCPPMGSAATRPLRLFSRRSSSLSCACSRAWPWGGSLGPRSST